MDTEPRLRLEHYEPEDADYTLLLPPGLDHTRAAPLVVALHYGGHGGRHYGRTLAEQIVAPAWETLGAVVLAPDCPHGAWGDARCERTVLGLVEQVRGDFPVDPDRIVLTGYSMGGIGTWVLAGRHPRLFRAAVVMAGKPPADLEAPVWRVPLYVIHAREDELMPLAETQAAVGAIRAGGGSVALEVLEGVTHFETHRFVAPLRACVPWLRGLWDGG